MKRKAPRSFKRSKRTRAKMRASQRARRARELHTTIHAKTALSAMNAREARGSPSLQKASQVLNGFGSGRTRVKPKNGSAARLSEPLESFSRAFGRALVQNLDVPSLAAKYGLPTRRSVDRWEAEKKKRDAQLSAAVRASCASLGRLLAAQQ